VLIRPDNPKGLHHQAMGVRKRNISIPDIQPVGLAPPDDCQHAIDTVHNTAMGRIRASVKMPFKVVRDTRLEAGFISVQEAAAKPLHQRF
jgi:hypothetical protein